MEKYRYIDNVEGTAAKMLIHGYIGKDLDGYEFARNVHALEMQGVKNLKVSFNSGGGSVVEAFSIYSALMNTAMHVECVNDGVAYSSAGWCWLAGNKCTVRDYSQWMCHPVSDRSGKADPAMIEMFSNSVATILAGKTGKPLEEIRQLMEKEVFMDASMMVNYGIVGVSDIYKTAHEADLVGNNIEQHVSICNSILIKSKIPKMSKVASLLKLSNEASEEAVAAEVSKVLEKTGSLEAKNAELNEENEGLKAKVAEFENKLKDEKVAKATELVENAITSKKIEATAKASWLTLANSNYDSAKAALDAMTGVKAHANILNQIKGGAKPGIPEDRQAWTHLDWQKKDPKGLESLQNNSPEVAEDLYNSYYKK